MTDGDYLLKYAVEIDKFEAFPITLCLSLVVLLDALVE